MFVKVTNGVVDKYPFTVEDLRREHKNVSFPAPFTKEILELYGLFSVNFKPAPKNSQDVYNVVLKNKPEFENGQWVLGWEVSKKPFKEAAAAVRAVRDSKLQETDWAAGSDVVMTDEMKTYRQALRDIPQQEGFPYNVNWP